jgi:hypothetical protein
MLFYYLVVVFVLNSGTTASRSSMVELSAHNGNAVGSIPSESTLLHTYVDASVFRNHLHLVLYCNSFI